MDPTPQEAAIFEQWLRRLWRDKDVLFERFHATGTFASQIKTKVRDSGVSVGTGLAKLTSGVTEIPVELLSKWEIPDAFGCFVPVLAPAFVWALWNYYVT
jgi:Acyltransferase C-terminus